MLIYLSAFEQLRKPIVDAKAITSLAVVFDHRKDNPDIQKSARITMKMLWCKSSLARR
jgi:hypothetical protein